MRSVTGKAAVVTLDRSVRIVHSRNRIFVAREAELVARICQQHRRFSGVRVMAVQAGPIRERLVLYVTRHEEVFGVVAISAELAVLRSGFKRIVGVSSIVAGLTFASEHGIVDARPQQGGQGRRMWIVADHARLLFHRITGMRRSEGAIVAFMARNAELRRCLVEQVLLRRGMRAMTRHTTVIFDHRVSYFVRKTFLLVAFEADRVALGLKQVR
jgi:hypothetical protein